jgi:uncharacterized OB-fold protein
MTKTTGANSFPVYVVTFTWIKKMAKECKSCGEEFAFYPGEYCGDCASKRDQRMGFLTVSGLFLVGVILGLFLGYFIF